MLMWMMVRREEIKKIYAYADEGKAGRNEKKM